VGIILVRINQTSLVELENIRPQPVSNYGKLSRYFGVQREKLETGYIDGKCPIAMLL